MYHIRFAAMIKRGVSRTGWVAGTTASETARERERRWKGKRDAGGMANVGQRMNVGRLLLRLDRAPVTGSARRPS